MKNPRLVFVYNADSGLFNTLTDIAHKLISPSTYNCQLCAITHSAFSMRDEWKRFIESLDIEPVFLHRDEWIRNYPQRDDHLPAVFLEGDSVQLFLSAREISQCRDISELKQQIKNRLSGLITE